MKRALLSALVAIPVLVLALIIVAAPRPRGALAQSSGAACCGPQHPKAPRELDFPYYSLQDGFSSTLQLVSDSPEAIDLTIAVHDMAGTAVFTAATIKPGEKLAFDLRKLLLKQGMDPNGSFGEGSVSVFYVGTIMPVVGQITMTNLRLSLVHESEMVENDPGRSDIPAVLSGLWWGLTGGRDARIMVSNTSANIVTADVFLDFNGQRHPSADSPLVFNPNETKVLSVAEMLNALNLSVAEVPQGGITIIQRGAHPALIAQGRVLDSVTGFSTTLEFPGPGRQHARALHASGLPIGTPTKDSPYAGAGDFVPHVVLRNLTAATQSVTIAVEYPNGLDWSSTKGPRPVAAISDRRTAMGTSPPQDAGADTGATAAATSHFTLAPFSVGPYSTVDFSLASVMNQLPLPLPFASIRIQYSGPPGSMVAQVSSVDIRQDLVVDARVQNEGNGWAGSGANPWHLDNQTEAILFLTDMGDQPASIGFEVTAKGVHYYLSQLVLAPHETRAINIRKLRDAQQHDLKGNLIPAGATDGSVDWIRVDNVPVEGRLMVITRGEGMASSYDCYTCPCPGDYQPGTLCFWAQGACADGLPATIAVGGTWQLYAAGQFQDCNGNKSYCVLGNNPAPSWKSLDLSVATVSGNGLVTGKGGGATAIEVDYTGCEDWQSGGLSPVSPMSGSGGGGGTCNCYASAPTETDNNATVTVISATVTEADIGSDQIGVSLVPTGLSGQLTVTAAGSNGSPTYTSVNQSEAGGSYTFSFQPASLPTGEYTTVKAQWAVSGVTASGTASVSFDVLGTYLHTQYNTPAESQCTGSAATAYLTTGPSSCPWSTVSLISSFISQAWINGSGDTNSYGFVQEYLAGCSAPPGGNSNYFREVSQVSAGCGGSNDFLSNASVAAPIQYGPFQCGDQVLIVGLAGGAGTVKTVTDECPKCDGEYPGTLQIDNYNTSNACSLGTLGNFHTIRINR